MQPQNSLELYTHNTKYMIDTISAPASTEQVFEAIRQVFAMQQSHQYTVARTTAAQRIQKLKRLHTAVLRYRPEIEQALWADLRKSPTEVAISEIGCVNTEIRHAIRNLRSWMGQKRAKTPLPLFGSSSRVLHEPKGVCLIISPWNFPLNLTLAPLASAIAAGNCVILKPSESTPESARVMKKIISDCFDPAEVALFEGEAEVAQYLTALPFNHIFFTGSPQVGKKVMEAAAKNLAGVTLELGGKCPVIVDEFANLEKAAAKITWLKNVNAGQICIAPDYVLVHEKVYEKLLAQLRQTVERFYGKDTQARFESPDLCRMIHRKHFDRVKALLDDAVHKGAKIAFGGHTDANALYVEHTLLTETPDDALIWEEEIFGPLLPIRKYNTLEAAVQYINARPTPLDMYIFSEKNAVVQYFLRETRSGGVTVNDCGVNFYNNEIPFGGVNNSGVGKAHGVYGFLEFSNARGIQYQNRYVAISDFFLPPYANFNKIKQFMLEGLAKYF